MNHRLLWVQAALLALGTFFSWTVLLFDYRRFFASGGHVLQFSGCAVANPLATPCFYGALAFLAAFVWSVVVLGSAAVRVAKRQGYLQWLLMAGTLFAWGNLAYVVYRFVQPQPAAPAFSCPPAEAAEPAIHPLAAPCFYGALIFLAALIVSIMILRSLGWPWQRWLRR